MSQQTPYILIVGPDSRIEQEVVQAINGLSGVVPIVQHVTEHRQGIELARSRRPDYVLIEMGPDLRALKSFAEEIGQQAPESNLAAVFSPEVFGPDVTESAVLIEALRAGIQDFLRRPVSRQDIAQLVRRLSRRAAPPPVSLRSGRVVSFLSNKGGVGKSTLSTNVACGLALRHPEQVLLIDGSLQMGVCANLLDLRPTTTMTDVAREHDRLDETLLRRLATPHASGLHLLAAPVDPVESAEITDEIMARILSLARRAYDHVIVDSFPLLDRVMLAVLDLSDRAYIVLESVVPTVLGIARFLPLLATLGVPADRLRLVVNRFTGSTDNLKIADVEQRLGRSIDHVLPYHKNVVVASNVGRPYILDAARIWGLGRALAHLVTEVEAVPRVGRSTSGRTDNAQRNGTIHEGGDHDER